MLLTSLDGASVELQPTRYQYAHVSGEAGGWDANWLEVHGRVRTATGESWEFDDPCLTTWEARELGNWLRAAAQGTVESEGLLTFVEPNLGFGVDAQDVDFLVIRVRLSHEAVMCRPVTVAAARRPFSAYSALIRIGREDVLAAARVWESDLTPFPTR